MRNRQRTPLPNDYYALDRALTVLSHPLINDRLTRLRAVDCDSPAFRQHLGLIARLLVPGATADLAEAPQSVTTPLETTSGSKLRRDIILVPILRAGLALCEGFLDLIPEAQVAHLGLVRNEQTLEPEVYYPLPALDYADAEVIVLDPMLATGGSALEALSELKKQGATRLRFVCLIAAPEGISQIEERHPDVALFTAAIDRSLDDRGYICPGLGDAGDRYFGT